MDITDREILDSALEDQAPEVTVEEPVAEVVEEIGQTRDEHGRFAPKEQPEPVAEAKPAAEAPKDEAFVPSWRLREMREEREAAERRFAESQSQWQRQLAELQSRLPKQEPTPPPDVFENPNAFLDHGVRQAVDPIKSEMAQLREFYSKREAIRDHGQEKVNAAYDWIAKGMQSRDPEIASVYQRAMASMDPFGEIVTAHQKTSLFQQIGNDPNAWFEKQLEERSKDPAFQAALIAKIQGTVREPGAKTPNIIRPPSLGRVAASAGNDGGDNDISDSGLFAHAMR